MAGSRSAPRARPTRRGRVARRSGWSRSAQRRGPVIGINVVALGRRGAARRRPARGARRAAAGLTLLALSVVYLPALLLLTAALEPAERVERLARRPRGAAARRGDARRCCAATARSPSPARVTVARLRGRRRRGLAVHLAVADRAQPGARRALLRDRQRARGDAGAAASLGTGPGRGLAAALAPRRRRAPGRGAAFLGVAACSASSSSRRAASAPTSAPRSCSRSGAASRPRWRSVGAPAHGCVLVLAAPLAAVGPARRWPTSCSAATPISPARCSSRRARPRSARSRERRLRLSAASFSHSFGTPLFFVTRRCCSSLANRRAAADRAPGSRARARRSRRVPRRRGGGRRRHARQRLGRRCC